MEKREAEIGVQVCKCAAATGLNASNLPRYLGT